MIVRLSHLGDVVCTLPVLHALHAAYPRARIAWVVQTEFADLLEGMDGLECVIPFERRGGLGAWRRVRRAMRAFRPELVVDAQGNTKSAAIAWCAGGRRVGWARTDWREPLGAWCMHTHAPPSLADRPHLVDRVATLIDFLAPAHAGGPLRHDAALGERELHAGAALLGEALEAAGAPALTVASPTSGLLPDGPPPAVLVHLSSPEDVRAWPVSGWDELVTALQERGVPVVVLSGPREETVATEFRARHPEGTGVAHLVGQRGLRELAGLFHAAGTAGIPLVAIDTGPMHLAWASGVRVVVLEGPQTAARTGPWPARGGPHVELRAPSEPSCAPCLARRCSHPEGPVCMSGIRVTDVLAALGLAST